MKKTECLDHVCETLATLKPGEWCAISSTSDIFQSYSNFAQIVRYRLKRIFRDVKIEREFVLVNRTCRCGVFTMLVWRVPTGYGG